MCTTLGRFGTKVKENPKLSFGLLATILFISIISMICLSKPGRGALLSEIPNSGGAAGPSSKPGLHYLSYFETLEFLSEAATNLFTNATVENIGNFFYTFYELEDHICAKLKNQASISS